MGDDVGLGMLLLWVEIAGVLVMVVGGLAHSRRAQIAGGMVVVGAFAGACNNFAALL